MASVAAATTAPARTEFDSTIALDFPTNVLPVRNSVTFEVNDIDVTSPFSSNDILLVYRQAESIDVQYISRRRHFQLIASAVALGRALAAPKEIRVRETSRIA